MTGMYCPAVAEWPQVDGVEDVKAGQRGVAALEVDLGDLGTATVSLFVVRGKSDGPVFHLMAGQHGVELNGCAAVDAFVNALDPSELSGTALAAPVANPVLTAKGEQYPELGEGFESNMNRIWPGKADGTFIERLARAIWENGLSTCDWCLDIHSWAAGQKPAALLSRESDELVAFGRATGLVFLRVGEPLPDEGYTHYGPTVARRQGRAVGCCVELSGQYQIFPDQVELGQQILTNLFKHANMLPGSPDIPERWINMATSDPIYITSPADALIQPSLRLGEVVGKGEPVARLWRFDTGAPEWLLSPVDGALSAFGALDQMMDNRAMSSAARAGERVASVCAFDA